MNKLHARLLACWRILSGRFDHWVLVNVDDRTFVEICYEDDLDDVQLMYHGMQHWQMMRILKATGASFDEHQTGEG